MSTNCIKCIVNKRTGPDLLCDSCRKKSKQHPDKCEYLRTEDIKGEHTIDSLRATLKETGERADFHMERSVLAMHIAEEPDWMEVVADCPMLAAVKALRARVEQLTLAQRAVTGEITLMQFAATPDAPPVFQWRDEHGRTYSPVYHDEAEARASLPHATPNEPLNPEDE